MKTNKLLFLGYCCLVVLFTGCSSKEQINLTPQQEAASASISKDQAAFEYKKGFDDGYKKAQKEQEQIQFERAKKIIKDRYLPYIKNLQIGAYLVKNHFITGPIPINIEKADGSMETKIEGCKIQKPYTLDDIFKIFGKVDSQREIIRPHTQQVNNNDQQQSQASNSISIVESDMPINLPSRINSYKKNITVKVRKTLENKNILDAYNAKYSIENLYFVVKFNNKDESNAFCQTTSICQ